MMNGIKSSNKYRSKATFNFDGTDDYVDIPSIPGTAGSVFVSYLPISGDTGTRTLFSYGGAAATNAGTLRAYLTFTGNNSIFNLSQRNDGAATLNTVQFAPSGIFSRWVDFVINASGTAWEIYSANTVSTLTVSSGANVGRWFGGTSVTAPAKTSIGVEYTNGVYSNYYKESLAYLVFFDRVLTAAEIKELNTLRGTDLRQTFSARGNILRYYDAYQSVAGANGIKDRSGYGAHGTANNVDATFFQGAGAPWRWYQTRDGQLGPVDKFGGNCWFFDGVNEYITMGDPATLDMGTNSFSISIWGRTNATAANYAWVSKQIGILAANTGYSIVNNTSPQIIVARITDGVATATASSSGSLFTENFYHVLVTFDRVNHEIKIYINGVQSGSTGSSAAVTGSISNAVSFRIGGRETSDLPMAGSLADPIIFNKALSQAEVTAVYNNHQPRKEETKELRSSIISYWRAYNSANINNNIFDLVGSNHGTPVNMEDVDFTSGPNTYPKKAFGSPNLGAFKFDGVNEGVIVNASSSNFSFASGGNDLPFSLCLFVNMTDATNCYFMGKGTASNYEYLLSTDATDKLELWLFDNAGTNTLRRRYNTAITTFQGRWIFICATYDGSKTNAGMKLHLATTGSPVRVDDLTTNSGSYTGMTAAGAPFEIGSWRAATNSTNAAISHASVWNKVLTTAEMNEIYNSNCPEDLSKSNFYSNLVETWYMNQQDSPITADGVVGRKNGYDGTATNMEAGDLQTGAGQYPA